MVDMYLRFFFFRLFFSFRFLLHTILPLRLCAYTYYLYFTYCVLHPMFTPFPPTRPTLCVMIPPLQLYIRNAPIVISIILFYY